MRTQRFLGFVLLASIGLLLGACHLLAAGEPAPAAQPAAKPAAAAPAAGPIHRFPKDPYIWVDRGKHEVYVKAQFSPDITGVYALLEFLLISGEYNEEDKTWFYEKGYESVFVTKADPYDVHFALLLAGFRPGPLPEVVPQGMSKGTLGGEFGGKPVEPQADGKKKHTGALLDIIVEWKEGDAVKQERIERFMSDRLKNGPADATPWAFTGSYLETNDKGEKVLASNLTHILGGVFYDESAIINLPYFTLNPHRGGGGLQVNANHLPPYFTKEKTIIEGYTPRKIKIPVHHHVTLIIRKSTMQAPDPLQRLKDAAAENAPKADPAPAPKAESKNEG